MDNEQVELFKVTYGSHLYGTNTPTSDVDLKVVYLPALRDVLLGKKLRTYKTRVDAQGNPVDDNAQMPDGGVEVEYVPFQTFCRDFLNGQTYALECAFARMQSPNRETWLEELVARFTTCNVSSMAGFAMKQTFDYVHRGVRLEKARALKDALVRAQELVDTDNAKPEGDMVKWRLDGVLLDGRKVLHVVAEEAGVELGTTVNNGKTMETLKLNGRDYLETTDLGHMLDAVQKLINSYGHRTQAAAEAEVDRKSLMHAVRVYQQALELLQTGQMTFPRPNREELLEVKTTRPLEQVKQQLLSLEQTLEAAMEMAKVLPQKTPEMEEAFEAWLLNQLVLQYKLPFVRFA